MIEVDFPYTLSDGRNVFVIARVGESVEIDSVCEIETDQIIPLQSLSLIQMSALELDAAFEYHDEIERRRSA